MPDVEEMKWVCTPAGIDSVEAINPGYTATIKPSTLNRIQMNPKTQRLRVTGGCPVGGGRGGGSRHDVNGLFRPIQAAVDVETLKMPPLRDHLPPDCSPTKGDAYRMRIYTTRMA